MIGVGWFGLVLSFAFEVGVQPPAPVPIVGGNAAAECDWPTAVLVESSGGVNVCSGVLVHPRVVLMSGHCFDPNVIPAVFEPARAKFGETDGAPQATIDFASCTQHPQYEFIDAWTIEFDVAVCTLGVDAPAAPIVPLLMECEVGLLEADHPLTVVGSGTDVQGTLSDGTKRYAANTLDQIDGPNLLSYAVGGAAACFGDSGGPVFAELPDGSWRIAALTSGAHPDATDNSCGIGAISELVFPEIPWVELTSGFDLTPCHDDAGEWEPTVDCGGFPEQLSGYGGSWSSDCGGALISGFSATCGDAFGQGGGTGTTGTTGTTGPATTDAGTGSGSGSSTTGSTGVIANTSEGAGSEAVDPTTDSTTGVPTPPTTTGASTTNAQPPATTSATGSTGSSGGSATSGDEGCGCAQGSPSLHLAIFAPLVVLVRRRRRSATIRGLRPGSTRRC